MGSVRVAIVGVGNCASSLVQGVEYYRDADPNDRVPGLMHVSFGDYHVSRRGVRRRLRRRRQEGRPRPRRGDRGQREQHHQALRRPADRGDGAARPDLRRPRPVLPRDGRGVRRRAGRRGRRAARRPGRRGRLLPAGRLRGGRPSSTPRPRSTPAARSSTRCRCSSPPTRRGRRSSPTPGCRSSATTSSRQVGATIVHRVLAKLFEDRGVELLRTYQLNFGGNMDFMNMLERYPAGVQEDLEDPVGDLPDPARDGARRRAHRTVRPRAVAGRPQVGLHPAGGPHLRRRAAQRRAQARGVGLAQLGRA